MNTRLVYNPSAGMRTAYDQLARVMDDFRARGWTADLVETTKIGEARELAHQAALAGVDAVIAVGGDGTVNEVANGIVDSATALGVLPVGTANVWAKEMGLPLGDVQAAGRLLAQAEVKLIDVGEVRGPNVEPRTFVLWCGVGLDAAITREIEPQRELKRRLGALMFWIVGARKAWSYRGRLATIKLEDRRVRKRIILALAANAQLYGGIVKIAPYARIDDNLLHLVVFKGTGFRATARHMIRVFLRMHLNDPEVEIYPTNCVSIEGRNLPVHVDAEPIGFTPVEIRIRPKALRVLVPETANQDLFSKEEAGSPTDLP